MTDVANLGFAVDSSGLDQAKQKLGEVTDSAKKTEDQAKKTGDALGKVGSTSSGGLNKTSAAADQLAASLLNAGKEGRSSLSILQQIDAVAAKTGVSHAQAALSVKAAHEAFRQVGTAAQAAAPATQALGSGVTAVGAAAAAAAGSVRGKAAAMSDLDRAAQRMGPVLNQFAGGLGAVLAASNAARGGLIGLGAVAGGAAIYGLAKVGDEVSRSEKLFEGLTGSASSGKTALQAAEKAARDSGIGLNVLTSSLQKAIQGQQDFASKTVIYSNSTDKAGKDAAHLGEIWGSLGKIIQASGGTAEEAAAILDAVGSSFQKTGTLTADALQKILNTSPAVALKLSQVFGHDTVKKFRDELANVPLKLEDFINRLDQLKPKIDALKWDPTIEQSIRDVQRAWVSLVQEISKAGGFQAASDAISGIAKSIDEINKRGFMPWLDDAADRSMADLQKVADGFSVADLALANLQKNGSAQMSSFEMSVRSMATNVASAVISMANSVAASISNMFSQASGSSGGGGMPSLSDTGDVWGGSSGGSNYSGGGSEPYFDYQSGSYDDSFVGAFASGGSFVVGGSGGTDSETVAFKATPGETVTVTTPGQEVDSGSAIASLTPKTSDGSLIKTTLVDEEEMLEKQTAQIVSAINALSALVKQNQSSATAAASDGFLDMSRGVSASGGGGGGGHDPFKKIKEEEKKAEQEREKQQREADQAARQGGGPQQLPSPVRSSRGGASWPVIGGPAVGQFSSVNPASSVPVNPSSLQSQDALDAREIERNTDETSRKIDTSNLTLDELQRTSGQTTQEVQHGASDTVDAVKASSDMISNAISTGLNDMGQAMSSAFGEIASAMSNSGSRGGGGGGGWSGGGSSGVWGGGYSSNYDGGGYGGGSFYDDSYYSGGGDYSGGGSFYDDSYYSGGMDSGSGGFDEAGFEGAFASGGQFTVGGDGGIDTTPVSFLATRGETVTIAPPGIAPPSEIRVPSTMLNPAGENTAQQQTPREVVQHSTKTVHINVNPGIQAEQFLRSRAQLARAM